MNTSAPTSFVSSLFFSSLAAAGLMLAGSAYSAGLNQAFQDAGLKKGTVSYQKILSSLNMTNLNLDVEESKENSFKLCKRRWLTSPAGAFSGLTFDGEMKVVQSAGEEDKEPVEVKGTFQESLANVTENGFDLKFAIQMGEDKKQEGVVNVTRAEYIVTCQELIEAARAFDEDMLIRHRYGQPKHLKVKTETETYQTIARFHSMSGIFADGSAFNMQKSTADTNFGVYRKALSRTDLVVLTSAEEKVESIMAMISTVKKVSVKEAN